MDKLTSEVILWKPARNEDEAEKQELLERRFYRAPNEDTRAAVIRAGGRIESR